LLKGPWGSAVKQAKDISQSQQDEEQQLKIPRTPRDIAQKGINQWILRLFNEVLRDRGQNELSQLPKATLWEAWMRSNRTRLIIPTTISLSEI